MNKRRVHFTEETVFDQVLQNDQVMKVFKSLKNKWKNKIFAKTYFAKVPSKKYPGKGTINFIIATKPK